MIVNGRGHIPILYILLNISWIQFLQIEPHCGIHQIWTLKTTVVNYYDVVWRVPLSFIRCSHDMVQENDTTSRLIIVRVTLE